MSSENPMSLCAAVCRVSQADALLSVWLETTTEHRVAELIGGLITILDGVADSIQWHNEQIAKIELEQHLEGRCQQFLREQRQQEAGK